MPIKICVLDHPRIRSDIHFNDIANTPLWSCLLSEYTVSSLKSEGFDVDYIDAVDRKWSFVETRDYLISTAPDLVLINAVYIWEHTGILFNVLDQLREKEFAGHISLLGFFPSLAYQDLLTQRVSVDSVIVGECEDSAIELAKMLEQRRSLYSNMGLIRSLDGKINLNRRPPRLNPDEFPEPFRNHHPNDTISILASRGCYNHCRFCPVPSFYHQGPSWSGRTPENIFQEVQSLVNQGARDFYFTDPNFVGPGRKGKDRIIQLMDLIRPLNIRFGMETRPNDLDTELLDSMVSAGLTSLLMGIESGSGEVLARINKHNSLQSSARAIQLCRDAGIEPEIGFLMFVPDSRLDDLKNNLGFLKEQKLLDRLERTANLLSHYQIVLKGTSGYQRFLDQKRLQPAGFLGFEGDVGYLDDRVKWVADVVIPVCREILNRMEQPDSSLYWERSLNDIQHETNLALIRFFEEVILLAESDRYSQTNQNEWIDKGIRSIIQD